jgi:hypothetical protein
MDWTSKIFIPFAMNFVYQVANTSLLKHLNDSYTYTLEGLKYANTLYDVRVYMKSPLAVGEDKWSAPTINTFRTKPTGEYKDNVVEADHLKWSITLCIFHFLITDVTSNFINSHTCWHLSILYNKHLLVAWFVGDNFLLRDFGLHGI